MRKIFISLVFVIMFISLASAEIILNEQPQDLYNLGSVINIPIKIVTSTDLSGFFSMQLICNGNEMEIHKEYLILSVGDEKQLSPSIPLIPTIIERPTGMCKIKYLLGEEYVLTNEFQISNLITIDLINQITGFTPEESLVIEGEAIKEDQKAVEGFVSAQIISEDSLETIEISDIVHNGYFYINYSLPKDTKAGQHIVNLKVYEKNGENITNNGFVNYNVIIAQIPTSLEVAFDNNEVEPGTDVLFKAILHDQTGEKIVSTATISIKNNKDIIIEQTEISTDEFLEFPIAYNEPAKEWTVVAVSNKITGKATFDIAKKEAVKTELWNSTLLITNMGNVLYNKTISVKIGNDSINVEVNLGVDEIQRYTLTAPDGEYEIQIMTDEESLLTGNVLLTGNAIGIKEASTKIITLIKYPLVWIFILAILGFVAFIMFKKGYKKSFFGYVQSRKKEKNKPVPIKKSLLIDSKNKAELSLSIKGEKQDVSLVCLKIKNFKEIETKENNVEETLQKIVGFAEEKKVAIYENLGNIFFMMVPIKTRTFKNEKTAVEIAQKIKNILIQHNKLFKQKIEFGISLNHGTIVAKQEGNLLKFMSMGTLITLAKKIASLSKEKILLSEKANEKLSQYAKTQKHEEGKIIFYTIKEIKDIEKHKKFLNNFIQRLEKEKKK